jgi:hypothetical protein
MLHTIGDSHAIHSFAGIDNIECHSIGAVMMESIGKIRKGKSSSTQLDMIISDFGITSTDVIILCFGEIDVRCKIYYEIKKGKTLDDIVNVLVRDYFTTILNSTHKKFWIFNVVPPSYSFDTQHQYPFVGSNSERSIYTVALNRELKSECQKVGMPFLDVYNDYADQSGMLNRQFSDGQVHIAHTEYVNNAITALLEK